jgi:hypothetical protein
MSYEMGSTLALVATSMAGLACAGSAVDDRNALHAYNPSPLYVDAVLAYTQAMVRDLLAVLPYFTWEASLPASLSG